MREAIKNYPLIIIILLMIISSCKKDEDPFHDYAPGLAGAWRFVHGMDIEKYLVINTDRTCTFLSSDIQGIRDKNDAILMVTGNQLMIDHGDPNVYPNISIFNYKVSGDSLKLSNPLQTLTLVKDKNSSTSTSWIKQAGAILSYKAPVSEPTDITFDGSLLWYGNGYSTHYLYSLNPADGKTDSLLVDLYAWAVEADSNGFWVSNDGSDIATLIRKSDGSTVTSSAAMGAWIYGIAKDNDYLWCYSNNEETLYKYKIADNTVSLSTKVVSNWDGLAMANNYLYVAANGKLHKCITAPLSGTASYELPGYYIFGVAYDGSSYWVSAYKLPGGWPEIIKLSGVD
jgi:hypothetical protein